MLSSATRAIIIVEVAFFIFILGFFLIIKSTTEKKVQQSLQSQENPSAVKNIDQNND